MEIRQCSRAYDSTDQENVACEAIRRQIDQYGGFRVACIVLTTFVVPPAQGLRMAEMSGVAAAAGTDSHMGPTLLELTETRNRIGIREREYVLMCGDSVRTCDRGGG